MVIFERGCRWVGWLMTDAFKTNVFDCELWRYLLISGKGKSVAEYAQWRGSLNR